MSAGHLPAEISIASAKLPRTYEHAKQALTACSNIDECLDWANKAEALASYAKQADDDSLRRMADRIQARAVRRCGELLKQFDGKGRNQYSEDSAAADTTRREAADAAGMSKRQQVTAVRVASLPSEKFEEWVEGETPPTVTKLAEAGKQKRKPVADHLQGRDPEQFSAATHTMGAMRRFAEKCAERDAEYIAAGILPTEIAEARRLVASIDAWLDRFVVNLKG